MADPSTTLPTGGASGFTPITDTPLGDTLDSLADAVGMNMFEEEIDDVIFMTNEFLSDSTFIGPDGAFWWILEACMCLGALFAVIMAAGMAYRMMVKGEGLDVLKILKVLGIGIVMLFWYPPSLGQHANMTGRWCILDALAYIPNCIGSYTHDLYEAEAVNVQDKFREMQPLLQKRDTLIQQMKARADILDERMGDSESATAIIDPESVTANQQEAKRHEVNATYVGMMIFFDKIVMFFAMVIYRIGWWATIYCQQILLGMLTIFGPIQWAFSLLPKWEGAWAKWITRYMTVHFYGAMLYFVGYFYNLTHSISYRLRIYISHPQQTCTKIAIKKSNEGGARAYWQVGFEIIDVFLFRLPSHLSLVWSCFLSNICPRISSCFGLIIWHKAVMFDIFSNRR